MEQLFNAGYIFAISINKVILVSRSLWFSNLLLNLIGFWTLASFYNYILIFKPKFVSILMDNFLIGISSFDLTDFFISN